MVDKKSAFLDNGQTLWPINAKNALLELINHMKQSPHIVMKLILGILKTLMVQFLLLNSSKLVV
jgi:hypothetical protein